MPGKQCSREAPDIDPILDHCRASVADSDRTYVLVLLGLSHYILSLVICPGNETLCLKCLGIISGP